MASFGQVLLHLCYQGWPALPMHSGADNYLAAGKNIVAAYTKRQLRHEREFAMDKCSSNVPPGHRKIGVGCLLPFLRPSFGPQLLPLRGTISVQNCTQAKRRGQWSLMRFGLPALQDFDVVGAFKRFPI
jgi:hypothetical protein